MTKGNRLSKRKRNVLRRDDYLYFHHCSFQICITNQAWSQHDGIYMAKFLFLHFVRLSKSPLFFSWLVMPWDFFARSLRNLTHWSSLRSLLRTYERSTSSKSSVLFTDTKSGPMKKRTTPIYATCSSPIMHLICPPKFCISIIFNLSEDGCNIQEK